MKLYACPCCLLAMAPDLWYCPNNVQASFWRVLLAKAKIVPGCELIIKQDRQSPVQCLSSQAGNVLFSSIDIAWESVGAGGTWSGNYIVYTLLCQLGQPKASGKLGCSYAALFFFFSDHQLLYNDSSTVIFISLPKSSQNQFCYEGCFDTRARTWEMKYCTLHEEVRQEWDVMDILGLCSKQRIATWRAGGGFSPGRVTTFEHHR